MIPNIPMIVPPPDEVKMSMVPEYLNLVLKYYGPPCDWCEHYDFICDKGYRPRKYEMELGPFEHWTIRKFCQEFEDRGTEGDDSDIRKSVSNLLDCNAQQYGG